MQKNYRRTLTQNAVDNFRVAAFDLVGDHALMRENLMANSAPSFGLRF